MQTYWVVTIRSEHSSDELTQELFDVLGDDRFYGSMQYQKLDDQKLDEAQAGDHFFRAGLVEYSFANKSDAQDFLQKLSQVDPHACLESREQQDWNAKWRESFEVLRIGDRFEVLASWKAEQASSERLSIMLEPGMAFGTGEHATTRLCMELIEKYGEKHHHSKGRALDFGSGSGILSIALAKLGFQVDAVEIDPVALEVAQQVIHTNRVAAAVMTSQNLVSVRPRYQLIVANILMNTLEQFVEDLVSRLDESGILILSGLLSNQSGQMRELYLSKLPEGYQAEEHVSESWVALVFWKV